MTLMRATLIFLLLLVAPSELFASDLPERMSWRGPLPLGDTTPLPANSGAGGAAFGGGVHLVTLVRHTNLAFVRLDAAGNVLDPLPVIIAGPGTLIQEADVAWDGRRFLVVWRNYFFELRGRFVRPDGTFEGGAFPISDATFGRGPVVTSNGETFLVAGGGHDNLTIVSGEGTVTPVDTAAVPYERSDVAGVEADGAKYLVLLELYKGIGVFEEPLLLRVMEDGTSAVLPFRPALRKVGLARAEDEFVLIGLDSAIRAFELSSEGEVVGGPHFLRGDPGPTVNLVITEDGSGGIIISGAADGTLLRWHPGDGQATAIMAPVDVVAPVASGSGRPLLLMRSSGILQHAFLESDGSIETPRPTVRAAPDQSPASLALVETGWFAAWSETRGGRTSIHGAVLSRSLAQLNEFQIANAEGTDAREYPGVAAGPGVALVVWQERQEDARILGRRYSHSGEPLDTSPFVIAADGYVNRGGAIPVTVPVVWNGHYFLIAVRRIGTRTLAVTRVAADGTVLDPDGIALPSPERESGYQHTVSMAVAGETTVVSWEDGVPLQECRFTCVAMPSSRVESVALDREGSPARADLLVLSGASSTGGSDFGYSPSIAAAGGRFLVVWRTHDAVVARLLDGDGRPIGQHFEIGESDFSAPDTLRTAVAGIGDRFAVVWDSALAPDRRRIHGRFVGNRGVLLESFESPYEIPDASEAYPTPSIHSDDEALVLLFVRWSAEYGGVRRTYMLTTREQSPRRRGVVRGSGGG